MEAYIGLAEAYQGMGKPDLAAEILEKGYDITGDERLRKYIDDMKEIPDADGQNENAEGNEGTETVFREARVEVYRVQEDGSRELLETYENTYDQEGHRTRCTGVAAGGADGMSYWYSEWYDEYIYDEAGNHIQTNCYAGDGLYYHYENIYDEEGRCVSEDMFSYYEGEPYLETHAENAYDDDGKLISTDSQDHNFLAEGMVMDIRHYDYVYDENGQKIQENGHYYSDGYNGENYGWEAYDTTSQLDYEYQYDEYGRCIREVARDTDGYERYTEYKYDEHGNRIYKTDGSIEVEYIWEEGNCIESGTVTNGYGDYSNRYSGGMG